MLLEILSGVLPVDENCDPMFLVSKQNNGSFLFSTRLSSSYSGMNAYDLKKEIFNFLYLLCSVNLNANYAALLSFYSSLPVEHKATFVQYTVMADRVVYLMSV